MFQTRALSRRTVSALAASLVVGATFGSAALAQDASRVVRVGMDVDAGTLDPRLARDTTAYRVTDLVYSGLVHLAADLHPTPDLAEKWDDPDPTTWIFHLRSGLKFSDGSPLTADDVAFTFQTILDPKTNAPQRALYLPIKSVDAVDPQTVKFTLSAPYAPLLSYLDIGIVPKKLVEGGADLGAKPIGSGPMKLVSWTRGAKMMLEPNTTYWSGAPKLKSLEITMVGDNTARTQAFEAGDLDVIMSPLSPGDIRRLQGNSRYGNAIMAGLGVNYLNYNVGDPMLADPKMRQALAMLVDQKTIVDQIYEGVDQLATSYLLPSSWSYSGTVKQPGYDPEGAKKLFGDMGWKPGAGGILTKNGQKLHIVLSTHSEDPNRVQAVEFMQAQFQQAGVDAEVRITDWPSFSTNYVQKGQHQVALLGWLNLVDPDRAMYGQLHTGGPNNWGKYSNTEVDALLDQGRSSLDQSTRKDLYTKAATDIARDLPYQIISYQGYQMFYNKALGTLQANPRGNLRNLLGIGQ